MIELQNKYESMNSKKTTSITDEAFTPHTVAADISSRDVTLQTEIELGKKTPANRSKKL